MYRSGMLRRHLALLALALAGCTVRGTVDNVPNRPVVDVTHVTPEGPSSPRSGCPANPPAISCAAGMHYACERDPLTGCDLCDCMR